MDEERLGSNLSKERNRKAELFDRFVVASDKEATRNVWNLKSSQ